MITDFLTPPAATLPGWSPTSRPLGTLAAMFGQARVPILLPGALPPAMAFSRASGAAYLDGAGALQTVGNNTPRFDGTAQRLMVEGQRTNSIRNPRAEGAVVGTPGALPTNWIYTGGISASGVSTQIVGSGTEGGIPFVDIRIFGTAAVGGNLGVYTDTLSAIAASIGQTWAGSFYWRLVAGTLTSLFSPTIGITEVVAGVTGNSHVLVVAAPTTAPLATQRVSFSAAFVNASTTAAAMPIYLAVTPGTVDVTLRIGGPQLEQAPFASSLILPPVGTPGASTRAADVANWASAARLPPVWTIYGGFMMPSMVAPNETTFPRIFSASDGTTANIVEALFNPALPNLQVTGTGAGTPFAGSASFVIGAGVFTKFAATFSQTLCGVRLSVAGGSPISSTGTVPPQGLRIISIGNRIDNARQNYGEFGPIFLIPGVFASDTMLQGLST